MEANIYSTTIDCRGRILLPENIRTFFKEKRQRVVVTRAAPVTGPHGEVCRGLNLLTAKEWEVYLQRIENDVNFSEIERVSLQRHFVAAAVMCRLNSEGFVSIPKLLRQYASLHNKIAVVEESGRFTVWRWETWDRLIQIRLAKKWE